LDLIGLDQPPLEGEKLVLAGHDFIAEAGLLRAHSPVSHAQGQTEKTFGFKWQKRDTFQSDTVVAAAVEWCVQRYGAIEKILCLLPATEHKPIVLDAGCGAGHTGLNFLRPVRTQIRYLGVDISQAVDVAVQDAAKSDFDAAFLQADLTRLPLPPCSVDVIYSEGVLHHTDSTAGALRALAPLLRRGGLFLFYVYRTKGPIREFTDTYVREKLQSMAPAEAWAALLPLTKLGKALGELGIEIDIREPIELLGIPAGRIDIQRLFYWHVMKAFYRPDYTLDEMNHVNFDWYAPKNAHRQTPEQVRQWCAEAGLDILRERVEEAGITIVARRE
jgi:SAM-dependent methyltransferase